MKARHGRIGFGPVALLAMAGASVFAFAAPRASAMLPPVGGNVSCSAGGTTPVFGQNHLLRTQLCPASQTAFYASQPGPAGLFDGA